MDEDSGSGGGGGAAAATTGTRLTHEQAEAAHAPLDTPLCIIAAAGTGKTTTMLERVRYMVDQGVPAEEILVLTFSRRAAAEFRGRLLRARVPSADAVEVSTFHSWSWAVLRRHWREAGFERPPSVAASEEQLLGVMRDCVMWDFLAQLASGLRSCLFLPPSAAWPDIAAAAAERHEALYTRCVRAAVAAHSTGEQPGSWLALSPEAAAALPFEGLPPRLQLLLACELHSALTARFGSGGGDDKDGSAGAPGELLAAAAQRAGAHLAWVEAQKRQGRMPDGEAYAALCAAAAAGGGGGGACQDAGRQALLLARVGAAYQEELRRAALASLSCLPLLARRLLAAGGGAAAWARGRWSSVVVDEFQDTGGVLLDLLGLLRPRRLTVVGDDDQSIYSFLAASPGVFGELRRRFGARTRCLQLNFRSTPAICAFGACLLRANRRAERKQMLAARGGPGAAGHPVAVRQYASAAAEAEAVAAEAQRLWLEEGVPYSSQAALFRCLSLRGAAVHAPLAAALRRRGVPCRVANHDRLADDAGVAALAAFLSVVADPACDPGFAALLGLPHHGLGSNVQAAVASQRHAARLAGRAPPSLLESAEAVCSQSAALEAAAAGGGASGSQSLDQRHQAVASQLAAVVASLNRDDLRELSRLVRLLRRMQRCVAREPLHDVVRRLLEESGLLAALLQDAPAAPDGGAAGGSQAPQAPPLPPKLQCVLKKAQELTAQWQAQHAAQQGPAGSGGSQLTAAEGSQDDGGSAVGGPGSQQGAALVRELLAHLAMDTAADAEGAASSQPASQPSSQPGDARAWPDCSQQEEQQRPNPGAFTVSTIHAAKGLEWDAVFVPCCNQGHLPVPYRPPPAHMGAPAPDAWQAHQEEERRLFHVAATRARHRLWVSYVQAVPPDVEGGAARASQAAADMAAALEGDPSDVPRCSAILAAAVRHLRRHAPGALHCQGRLPDEQWLGLFDGELEVEERAARQQQRRQQQGSQQQHQHQHQQQQQQGSAQPLAGGSQANAGSGGSQGTKLSLAEQVRLRLAPQGGGVSKPAAIKIKARRKAVLLRPAAN